MMVCDICDSTGYIITEKGISIPCKCRKKRVEAYLCQHARISKAWRKRAKYPLSFNPSFKAFFGIDCRKRVADLSAYFELLISDYAEFPSVYVWGDNGRGKSHIMYSLVLEAIRRYSITAFVVTEARLVELAFGKPTNTNIENDVEIVQERLETVSILLIDDIGASALDSKGYKEGFINKVIRNRREEGKTTWMTSNVTPDHMDGHFGRRLASYLLEMCHFLRFSTKRDLRLTKQREINKKFAKLLVEDVADDDK